MYKKILPLLVTFLIASIACLRLSEMPLVTSPTLSPEDIKIKSQEVYSFITSDGGDVILILEDVSIENYGQDQNTLVDSFSGISQETVSNFLEQNSQPGKFPTDLDLGKPYILLTPEVLLPITSESNWGVLLKEQYPDSNGYYYFSRAGFNQDFTQALVYAGHVFGPLACSGDYFFLEFENGEWLLKDQNNIVIC